MTEQETIEHLTSLEQRLARFAAEHGWELIPGAMWGSELLGSRYAELRHASHASVDVRVSDHTPTSSASSMCAVYLYPADDEQSAWEWQVANSLLPEMRYALLDVLDDDSVEPEDLDSARAALEAM